MKNNRLTTHYSQLSSYRSRLSFPIAFTVFFSLLTTHSFAQELTYSYSPSNESMRGVHVVNENVIWASGAKGTILRSIDAGDHWQRLTIDGADEYDFRDVHGFDENHACLMVAGTPARIYRTTDGGDSWEVALEDKREGAFFNAMDFWDESHGIAFGDAIDGRLAIAITTNGGRTWELAPEASQPQVHPDVHGYAASGTCLTVFGEDKVFIGLGGVDPEFGPFALLLASEDRGRTWKTTKTSVPSGPTSGIFSVCMIDEQRGVAVGGNYRPDDEQTGPLAITEDGGATWSVPDNHGLRGYRSAVQMYRTGQSIVLVATGPFGSDFSTDGGKRWRPVEGDGYHALSFEPNGKLGWAVGSEGRMARWED